MECIFCKIIAGEVSSKKIYEDGRVLAFLDINPANRGHVLVIPKKHYESIIDIDDATLKELISVAKAVAKSVKERLNPDGINILQNNGKHAGQLVSHMHFHVIPRFPDDKVLITYQRVNMTDKEFDDVQKEIAIEAKKEIIPEKKKEVKTSTKWEKDF